MDNNVMIEEELSVSDDILVSSMQELVTKGKVNEKEAIGQIRDEARGKVRILQPRWGLLERSQSLLNSGTNGKFYLIRFGFEFEVPPENYIKGCRFVFARCQIYFSSKYNSDLQPKVYDLYPRNLFEGEPHKINLKLGPEFKVGEFGGSLGEVSADLTTGYVSPAIIGYFGQEERAPYWDFRPITKEIVGVYHLWAILEVQEPCEAIRVVPLVEADIQTRFGPIAIGPREKSLEKRISSIILLKPTGNQ